MKGSVPKRCLCAPELDARGRRKSCCLDHGSWSFLADLGPDIGSGGLWRSRRQVERGGYGTRRAAEAAPAAVADGTATHDTGLTVVAYLASWLEAKRADGLRPSTLRSYTQHVDLHLVPAPGHHRLRDLRPVHVEAALAQVMRPAAPGRRQAGPATVQRVRATLRSALASAEHRRLVAFNAATDLELPR